MRAIGAAAMHLPLLLDLTRQDFRDRYAGSMLGMAWAFINPLAMIFIFTVVFSNVMGARLPGTSSVYAFSVYLVSGLLPWMAFANTLTRSASVFLDRRNIIGKVRVSLPQLPIYIVISETITFLIAFAIFLVFLVATGALPGKVLLVMPLVFLLQQIFAFGLGLFFGVLNVFIRDIKEMLTVMTTFWFWFTPIVWVRDIAPGWVQRLQEYFNPAYLFIDAYHRIFVHGQLPDLAALTRLAILAHVMVLLSWLMLRALERDVRDFI